MKANILKISLLALSFNAFAIDLPQIQKPLELESGEFAEGTITKLSSEEIKDYLPWAMNAKRSLENAQAQLKRMNFSVRLEFLEKSVKSVVKTSEQKKYQMLMRFALNRGLLLAQLIKDESSDKNAELESLELDILNRSIQIALEFYESDFNFQRKSLKASDVLEIPHAEFGVKLATIYFIISEQVFDASAQYQMMRKNFEILLWDLKQDRNAIQYAEEIVEIFDLLQSSPEKADDELAIKWIRELNYLKAKTLESLRAKNPKLTLDNKPKRTFGPCGLEGSVSMRIRDCSELSSSKKKKFVLVTRTEGYKEVWKDLDSGLLWGDKIDGKIRFHDAQKVCNTGLEEVGLIDSVKWRMPSVNEFKEAWNHSMSVVLPNMDFRFWTSKSKVYFELISSSFRLGRLMKAFDGQQGIVYEEEFYDDEAARCVGKE